MRAFVTTRGRGGVSFGLIGTVIVGSLYLMGVLVIAFVYAIVALGGLCMALYKGHQRKKPPPAPTRQPAVSSPPPRPPAPSHEQIPLQSSKMAEGDVVTLTDSNGREHRGVLANRHRKEDGSVGFDLIEDPRTHSRN